MRINYISLMFLLLFLATETYAQMVEVPLIQRITEASTVIEGECISQHSFWNIDRTMIYTSSIVEVHKLFKGKISFKQVEVIAPGGIVGDNAIDVCPNVEVKTGSIGIYLIKPYSGVDIGVTGKYEYVALAQGFIEFNGSGASDPFRLYRSIDPELYGLIRQATGRDYETIVMKNYFRDKANDKNKKDKIQVSITSFTPTTVNGGVSDILTIVGTDFGTSIGTVNFRNADDGGYSYYSAPSSHISTWNDTMIRVRVPARAGSGTIQVINSANQTATSVGSLTVNYAVLNGNDNYRTWLVNTNSNGGYTFRFSQDLFYNQPAVNAFLRAIQSWRCGTYVKFDVSSTPSTVSCRGRDGVNLLSFANTSCTLPTGVLGLTISYWMYCSGGTNWYLEEADLTINPDYNWNYGPDATQFNEHDLETVVLHELGHCHQLGHVINSNLVMHYSISAGVEKRALSASSDIAGGESIMEGSASSGRCGMGAMTRLNSSNCSVNFLPIADFSASSTAGCGMLAVNFSDQTTNSPTEWYWDIDNNGTTDYTVKNPSHIYTQTGTYSVKLIVANAYGRDTLIKDNYIQVNPLPTPNITGNLAVCMQNAEQYSTNLVSGVSNQWYVTGGSINGASNGFDVNVTWGSSLAGTVKVVQTVTATGCRDSMVKNVNIRPLPETSITGSLEVCAKSQQSYSAPAGSTYGYKWLVGGGSIIGPSTSRQVSISWGASSPGSLKLILTDNDTGCKDSLTKTVVINPLPIPEIVGRIAVCANNEEHYKASVTNNRSCKWKVTGGTIKGSATADNITVTWGQSGQGSIRLVQTNTQTMCADSIDQDVIINPLPTPTITGSLAACTMSEEIYLVSESPGLLNLWTVSGGEIVGDNNKSTVNIRWTNPGDNNLKIVRTVMTTGCIDSAQIKITVNQTPGAEIQGSTTYCEKSNGRFYTSRENGISSRWIIQGGSIVGNGMTDSIDVKWGNAGSGKITLIRTNTLTACVDTATLDVNIGKLPQPTITGHDVACPGKELLYISNKRTGIINKWKVEGGNIVGVDTSVDVKIIWENVKQGTITLIQVDSASGCSDSVVKQVTIREIPEIIFNFPDKICLNNGPVDLTAEPPGGEFSGEGILEGKFVPDLAGTGIHTIKYKLGSSGDCENIVSRIINVMPIPDKPVVTYEDGKLISSYANGNQWYNNGQKIEGAINSDYIPNISGSYSVQVKDTNGCYSDMSDAYTVEINGISEYKLNHLEIFPNPASDNLSIRLSQEINGNFELTISDILGRERLRTNILQSVYVIDVKDFENGTYFVRLVNGNIALTKNIIIYK